MSAKNFLLAAMISTLLTACFDDDDTSTTPTPGSNSSADSAYTGIRTEAGITEANAGSFPKSAFAARDFTLIGSGIFAVLPGMAGREAKMGEKVADFTLSQFGARTVDGTATCTNDGQISVTADVDDDAHTGTLTTTFSNCMVDGTVLDGPTETHVTAYDAEHNAPTAMDVTFKGLSLTTDGNSTVLTGTQSATQDVAAKTANLSSEMHLKAGTGEEALAKIATILTSLDNGSASSTLEGSVCIGTTGCVNMQTVKAFTVDANGEVTEGELLLTGSKGSKAQVLVLKAGLVQINVDEDGDGTYEKHVLLD